MMELAFTPASQEDADAIYSLCKQLVQRYEDPNEVDIDRALMWLKRKIHNQIACYTCVWLGNEKVAYFSLAEDGKNMELDDLYVLEDYRNRGIGGKILERCISTVEKPIYLYVFTDNLGAIRLYERYGFSVTQRVSSTRAIMIRYP